jgi:hypothetical protein
MEIIGCGMSRVHIGVTVLYMIVSTKIGGRGGAKV